jgi:hypothetical protein
MPNFIFVGAEVRGQSPLKIPIFSATSPLSSTGMAPRRCGNDADERGLRNAVPVGRTSGCDALPLRSNRIAGGYAATGHWGKCCVVAANIGGRPGAGCSSMDPGWCE